MTTEITQCLPSDNLDLIVAAVKKTKIKTVHALYIYMYILDVAVACLPVMIFFTFKKYLSSRAVKKSSLFSPLGSVLIWSGNMNLAPS